MDYFLKPEFIKPKMNLFLLAGDVINTSNPPESTTKEAEETPEIPVEDEEENTN